MSGAWVEVHLGLGGSEGLTEFVVKLALGFSPPRACLRGVIVVLRGVCEERIFKSRNIVDVNNLIGGYIRWYTPAKEKVYVVSGGCGV